MPVKLFCDRCFKETPRNYMSWRATVRDEDWVVQTTVRYEGVWNAGILCLDCLKGILRDGEWDNEDRTGDDDADQVGL